MTLQDAEHLYGEIFGETCPVEDSTSLSDIERSIEDCAAMLDYSLETADKNEIKFWRRMLQKAKVQRRELLAT